MKTEKDPMLKRFGQIFKAYTKFRVEFTLEEMFLEGEDEGE